MANFIQSPFATLTLQKVSVGQLNHHGEDYPSSYTTESGQSALVPAAGYDDYGDIQELVSNLLASKRSTSSTNY